MVVVLEAPLPMVAAPDDLPVTGKALLLRASPILRAMGLAWCGSCLPHGEHVALLRRIVAGVPFPIVGGMKPLSAFGLRPRADGSYGPDWRCKRCNAEATRRSYHRNHEKRKANKRAAYAEAVKDPEWAARKRAASRDSLRRRYAKARGDEAEMEKLRAAHRRWWQKLRSDPERYATYLEDVRIEYRLRRERLGLPTREGVLRGPSVAVVPVGPFRTWLVAVLASGESDDHIEAWLGTTIRSLRRIAFEGQRFVAVSTVDLAVMGWPDVVTVDGRGVFTFDDLYGERVPLDVPQPLAVKRFGDSEDGRVLPLDDHEGGIDDER